MIIPSNEFVSLFKKTEGALGVSESIAIMNIASEAPQGIYMELGTHKGKSAMSAAYVLKRGVFYLVDICFDEDSEDYFGDSILCEIKSKIKLPTSFIGTYSTTAIRLKNNYAYVFIDSGSHGDGLPMQEVKLLEDRIIEGGIIAFHDYKNQFTEVEQAYNYLLITDKYEEIKINWDKIFAYVKEHNLEEGNNSWHQYPDLPHPPNFIGALRRK